MIKATVGEVYDCLNKIAPFELQEDYDNAGIIVGSRSMEVKGVLFSLDATPEIIEEAIENNCNLVISHHPIVFKGLKQFNGKNYVERAVMIAIKNDIALIAIHTNLDNVIEGGVNGMIAKKLRLKDLKPLKRKGLDDSQDQIGSGLIGELEIPVETSAFLEFVKKEMRAGCVKYTKITTSIIQKVAVCGGSGSFLLGNAIASGADIFISSDFKYHEFFDAEDKIIIVDIGHYETEQFTIELLFGHIKKNFSNFAALITKLNTNPVKYL